MGIGYGKLLLFGEHAVVHGHPAVGTGTDLHTEVTFDPDMHPPGREDAAAGGAADTRRETDRPAPGSAAPSRANHSGTPIVVAGRKVATEGLHPDDVPSFVEALESARTYDPAALKEPRALRLESNVPRGVGLGSSSALCAALASELLGETEARVQDQDYTPAHGHEVWRLAHHLEHVYHGTPSGVDTCLSTFGGLRAVYPQPGGEMPHTELLSGAEGSRLNGGARAPGAGGGATHPSAGVAGTGAGGGAPSDDMATTAGSVPHPDAGVAGTGDTAGPDEHIATHPGEAAGLTVVYGYMPRSGDTRALVGEIRNALEAGNRDVGERLEELGRISGNAIEVLRARQPDAGALGALANEAQRHLEALGLSNEALRAVFAAGTGAGARGGKLSGAGGGGAWFLVFDTPRQAENGREAVIAAVGEIPAFTLPVGG